MTGALSCPEKLGQVDQLQCIQNCLITHYYGHLIIIIIIIHYYFTHQEWSMVNEPSYISPLNASLIRWVSICFGKYQCWWVPGDWKENSTKAGVIVSLPVDSPAKQDTGTRLPSVCCWFDIVDK